jgi:hypothetical protein
VSSSSPQNLPGPLGESIVEQQEIFSDAYEAAEQGNDEDVEQFEEEYAEWVEEEFPAYQEEIAEMGD